MVIARAGEIEIGDDRALALIAGPCVIESEELCMEIAGRVVEIAREIGMPYIFKASFDKANRTSVESVSAEILADVGVGGNCGLRQLLLD